MHQPLKLPAGRVALVLVDLQEEHRQDPRYLVESYDRVLGNAARLMAAARSSGVPVIHAAYVRDFDDVPPRPFEPVANGAPVFSVRGDGTKICAEVEPAGGETVIEKNDASCFVAQEFEAEIAKLAPDWLVVAGVWTEACIAATVRDAVAQGLRVLLVKDACGSGTESMHQSALGSAVGFVRASGVGRWGCGTSAGGGQAWEDHRAGGGGAWGGGFGG